MSRIFLSHSGADNAEAVALRGWLAEQGWDDIFLDLDPERGIKAGERWKKALSDAASRCEAVLFLVSRTWLDAISRGGLEENVLRDEFDLARHLSKSLFGVIITNDLGIDTDLPDWLKGTWQVVNLAAGRDQRRFRMTLPQTHEQVEVTFSNEGLVRLRGGLRKAGLDPRFFDWPPARDPDRPPYRGLRPLEAEDAGIFFGRDAPVVEAIDRLRGLCEQAPPRLVVILGASGSGKSSFLRAGLLPRLARDDRNFLPLPVIRPERAVLTGESGLVRSLETAFQETGRKQSRAEISAAVAKGGKTVCTLLQRLVDHALKRTLARATGAKPPTVVLPVDQAEELFDSDGLAEGAAMLGLARYLAIEDRPATIVLFTIRSDSYERLQKARALEGLRQQALALSPMPRGAYQMVIEGPAARLNETSRKLVIQPGLTQRLLQDIEQGDSSDALPLLAFTLEQLYLEYGRGSGEMKLVDYDKFGRIRGAIGAAVERALVVANADPRIPRERKARLTLLRRGLIPWLASIDPETGSPRRRVARLKDVPPGAKPLIQLLVEHRLLATDRRPVREGSSEFEITIEPAHEALLRQWGLLRRWLEEDSAALTTLEAVKRAAREWVANAKRAEWLNHTGTRLEEAENIAARRELAGDLSAEAHHYLRCCRERDQAERREKEATLAREEARLAEIATAQKRTARLQRISTLALGAVTLAVTAGIIVASLQQFRLRARQRSLNAAQENMLGELASVEESRGNLDGALRFAVRASIRLPMSPGSSAAETAAVRDKLVSAALLSHWRLVLSGHEGLVRSASFSPDGKRIVTASYDRTARIWDTATGQQIALLRGHDGALSSASFSPDGKLIVTASYDTTARIWDAVTGQQIALLRGHHGALSSASFSPDGKLIVTASFDETARIWGVATGQQTAVLRGHDDTVFSAGFSPDSKRIVTASADRTARIWDATTGRQVALLRGHDDSVDSANFSRDGKRIITASDDRTARIWDAATGRQMALLRGHDGDVLSASFSPDGKDIVTASLDQTARIWDAATGEWLVVLGGHEGALYSANFSRDGKHIVTASDDRTARIWDTMSGQQLVFLHGHQGGVDSATFRPDGQRIVTASGDKTARIWDVVTGQQMGVLRGHDDIVLSAEFSPDGKRIVTASEDKTVRIWDAATSQQIGILRGYKDAIRSATFSPDGKHIVTASDGATVSIWDVATGHIAVLSGHEGLVSSGSFSPDGKRIVTASYDRTARIWDTATGQQSAVLRGHEDKLTCAGFSPDGKRIVTGSFDKTARIWDVVTGQQMGVLRGHDDIVLSAEFSPDGKRIVTGSFDKTARIWDAATGQQIAVLQEGSKVWGARYSPDGKRIVIALDDGMAQIWDVRFATMPSKDLVIEVCTWRLRGISRLTRYEMSLAGYPEDTPLIDVCNGP